MDHAVTAAELPEVVLTQGLHDITSLLVTECTLDDVLRVILETIYRALGVVRTRAFFLEGPGCAEGPLPVRDGAVTGRRPDVGRGAAPRRPRLFYIDGDDAGARLLSPPVLNSLKVLHTQAVLAIHQSTLRSLARKR